MGNVVVVQEKQTGEILMVYAAKQPNQVVQITRGQPATKRRLIENASELIDETEIVAEFKKHLAKWRWVWGCQLTVVAMPKAELIYRLNVVRSLRDIQAHTIYERAAKAVVHIMAIMVIVGVIAGCNHFFDALLPTNFWVKSIGIVLGLGLLFSYFDVQFDDLQLKCYRLFTYSNRQSTQGERE